MTIVSTKKWKLYLFCRHQNKLTLENVWTIWIEIWFEFLCFNNLLENFSYIIILVLQKRI